jgi:hypothetical protein
MLALALGPPKSTLIDNNFSVSDAEIAGTYDFLFEAGSIAAENWLLDSANERLIGNALYSN